MESMAARDENLDRVIFFSALLRAQSHRHGMVGLTREHRKRLLVVLLGLVVLAILASSDAIHVLIQQMLEFSEQWIRRHPRSGMLVFVLFSMLSAMLAFLSSALLIPIAIFAWGEPLTLLLLWVGWLLGGATAYLIGRYFGTRVVRWIIPEERMEAYEGTISRRARFPVVVLFQLALPSEVPGYVLGTLRYRFHLYLAALAISELPYAVGAVLLGKSFLEQNFVELVAIGAAGILLMTVAIIVWQRSRTKE